jgi:tRNA pseudouridine55 synthase
MKSSQQLPTQQKDNPHVLPASRVTPDGNATASRHGLRHCTRRNRQGVMNGVVVVDKPSAMTSAQVVAQVKALLKAKKVGHTGTLDPFATGVLVCCINEATRLARFLISGRKGYEATMRLGIRTDTQDLTGQVISREPSLAVTHEEVHSTFQRFLEVKEQVPPAFSALKHQGVPLYRLARRGTFVQKPARRISLYELRVLDIHLPYVHFGVSCSQGTYVRTLSADIGDAMGCGAHLVQLCRTESGGFTLEEAVSLSTLKGLAETGKAADRITPMAHALKGFPEVKASRALALRIRHGQPITGAELGQGKDAGGPWIKVTDDENNLIAVLGAKERDGVYPYACVFANHQS